MNPIFKSADCCGTPNLVKIREICMTYRDAEILYQCQNCSQQWLYRFHESMLWPQSEEITETITKISEENCR